MAFLAQSMDKVSTSAIMILENFVLIHIMAHTTLRTMI